MFSQRIPLIAKKSPRARRAAASSGTKIELQNDNDVGSQEYHLFGRVDD